MANLHPWWANDPLVPGAPPNPVVFSSLTPISGPNTLFAALKGSATLSRSGGTSASASSGQGGWQITDRTRRKASTEWLDYYPLVQAMSCVLDGGLQTNTTPVQVEDACHLLENFEIPVLGSYPQLPPIIAVKGPVMHTELFWVCSRLSFDGGDVGQIRNAAGQRVQQHFTIELTEYVPTSAQFVANKPSQSQLPAVALAGFGAVQPSGQWYTCVPGDSLTRIAAVVLGNVNLWSAIALLNGLSNSALLYPGERLQLPAV